MEDKTGTVYQLINTWIQKLIFFFFLYFKETSTIDQVVEKMTGEETLDNKNVPDKIGWVRDKIK